MCYSVENFDKNVKKSFKKTIAMIKGNINKSADRKEEVMVIEISEIKISIKIKPTPTKK